MSSRLVNDGVRLQCLNMHRNYAFFQLGNWHTMYKNNDDSGGVPRVLDDNTMKAPIML